MIKLTPAEKEKIRRILAKPVPLMDEMCLLVMTFTTFDGVRLSWPAVRVFAAKEPQNFMNCFETIRKEHLAGRLLPR